MPPEEEATTPVADSGTKGITIKATNFAPRKGTDDEGDAEGLAAEVAKALRGAGENEKADAFLAAVKGASFDDTVEAAKQHVTIKLKK